MLRNFKTRKIRDGELLLLFSLFVDVRLKVIINQIKGVRFFEIEIFILTGIVDGRCDNERS